MTAVETAAGAVQIVEFQMAELMRQMTVERGFDPRDFVVYGYGGAAGAHVARVHPRIRLPSGRVPLGATASTWSALGVQAADLSTFTKNHGCSWPVPQQGVQPDLRRTRTARPFAAPQRRSEESDIAIERAVEMNSNSRSTPSRFRCAAANSATSTSRNWRLSYREIRTHSRARLSLYRRRN